MRGFRHSRTEDLGAVAVAVIDESTGNFALVIDHQKPEPHYWKFPGGKIDPEDVDPQHPFDVERAAERAAVREVAEETGLAAAVMPIGIVEKRTHRLYLFVGLADFSGLAATGDEGERVKSFSLAQIRALPNFFDNHRGVLELALSKIKEPVLAPV